MRLKKQSVQSIIRQQNIYMEFFFRVVNIDLSMKFIHGLAHAGNAKAVVFFTQ